jgi:hypothetical protein
MTATLPIPLADLLRSANQLDRGELTKAGRAWQKHGDRLQSKFPKALGNPIALNQQAEIIVNGILTHPQRTVTQRHHARFGNIIDIYVPNGQGVRYDVSGNFIGLIEL